MLNKGAGAGGVVTTGAVVGTVATTGVTAVVLPMTKIPGAVPTAVIPAGKIKESCLVRPIPAP